ncbi:MAG: NUDIX hydrolase N-terminal domain-containing protein [Chloroflexi bacterium]|nr:NUDIX hydrolase N-terminal domain-containing protein [Chloroflexota bacterium]
MSLHAQDVYLAIDELRAIAGMGLEFARNDYERERYLRLRAIAARLFAKLEERPVEHVTPEFHHDNWLHVSPMSGAEAAVFQNDKLLLMKRSDNGLWAVPGGLTEVGETLAETAQRELWEEVGVRGRVIQLLGIFDSRRWSSRTKAHLFHTIFQVERIGGTPAPSAEALDVRFFGEDNLPELAPGHTLRVPLLFKLARGEMSIPYFDTP